MRPLAHPTLEATWREAGTSRRTHLVMTDSRGHVPDDRRSICGMVRLAAWVEPSRKSVRCRSCLRFKKHWKVRS